MEEIIRFGLSPSERDRLKLAATTEEALRYDEDELAKKMHHDYLLDHGETA